MDPTPNQPIEVIKEIYRMVDRNNSQKPVNPIQMEIILDEIQGYIEDEMVQLFDEQGELRDQVLLAYANATKFVTNSTGIDVTGTVTADGLTVDGKINYTSAVNGILNAPASMFINIDSDNNNTGEVFRVTKDADSTSGTKLFEVKENGDISFYEDTGTTAKFFWDASAESLGIGTSSPSSLYGGAANLVVGALQEILAGILLFVVIAGTLLIF